MERITEIVLGLSNDMPDPNLLSRRQPRHSLDPPPKRRRYSHKSAVPDRRYEGYVHLPVYPSVKSNGKLPDLSCVVCRDEAKKAGRKASGNEPK